jgi:hypothetical protein
MAKYFSCYGFIDIKAVKIFALVAITLLPNGCRFGEVAKIRKMQEVTTVLFVKSNLEKGKANPKCKLIVCLYLFLPSS